MFQPWVRRNFPLAIERIINDALISQIAAASLHKLYGDNITRDIEKVMGGEDFAFYCETTPGPWHLSE